MGILDTKVAVITGGTRGLGLAIAMAYAREGASVVIASRSSQSVEAAVQQLREMGAKATGIAIDVSDLAQVESLAKYALSQFGRIDVWVNNAGTAGPYGATLGYTPEAFRQVLDTNITGVYNGSRTAMQVFLKQGSGKLINILGHGYNRPVAWQNAYASSKAWGRSFTKSLANETKDSGIGVFAFNPGLILTELLTEVDVIEGSEDRLKAFPTVVRMWAKPPEVPARKALWIASSATDGKTGLLVNLFSPWSALKGAAREGLRVLFKKPVTGPEINLRQIPPYFGKL